MQDGYCAHVPSYKTLRDIGEHFASGYYEEPDASPIRRWSRAVRRRLEYRTLHPYRGEHLYPCGRSQPGDENKIVSPNYSYTWIYNESALLKLIEHVDKEVCFELELLRNSMRDLESKLDIIRTVHIVGGRGYTHSIPNYGRVMREGLSSYERRIDEGLSLALRQRDQLKIDFYYGMKDVIEGIRRWHARILNMLKHRRVDDDVARIRLQKLISAYEQVPFYPARDFFEAMVAYNFVYYLDDCDNPGRVDQELYPYYERDVKLGKVNREYATELIRCLWQNVDANNGWSAGIGGIGPSGEPSYNELTIACLEAAKRMRRPNLQLHVRRDMPQEVWETALDTIATGCGLPALYNDEGYITSLREAHLGIRESDLGWYNGGGCTETMIHGRSNVGSLDAGINLPLILVETLRKVLPSANSFEEVVLSYKEDVKNIVRLITDEINADQQAKAKLRPQPMRSLLIDDCIDNGIEFNAGGARYNWSVVNVAGLANVVDSLSAIREVVFEKKEKSGTELLEILERNFEGHEVFRRRLERCPRFGNGDPRADEIAKDISNFVFKEFLRYAPWRGGKFIPACLMFVTYADAGIPVGATPDGRFAGAPLADSAGPVQGRDKKGPTAMLKSVATIPHNLAPGTLVVNARFTKDLFTSQEGRKNLKDMIMTYFDMGGMQIQINVVDQETLKDAIAHPEKYEDLIIRVGGYSEYFNRLSPALKQTILERIEHR